MACSRAVAVLIALNMLACARSTPDLASRPGSPGPTAASAPPVGGCETPAAQRTSEVGCYLSAIDTIGVLDHGPLYWHLYEYATHAEATARQGSRGTVVETFGRVLLHSIADESWRAEGGRKLATIGPLPYEPGVHYTARYIEGIFMPGMLTTAHRHSGAEAWYVFEGAQCLETPEGATTVRAGESAIVRGGPAMVLNHVGAETRRSVALVLHDTAEPWITRVPDWTPRGLCQQVKSG